MGPLKFIASALIISSLSANVSSLSTLATSRDQRLEQIRTVYVTIIVGVEIHH